MQFRYDMKLYVSVRLPMSAFMKQYMLRYDYMQPSEIGENDQRVRPVLQRMITFHRPDGHR